MNFIKHIIAYFASFFKNKEEKKYFNTTEPIDLYSAKGIDKMRTSIQDTPNIENTMYKKLDPYGAEEYDKVRKVFEDTHDTEQRLYKDKDFDPVRFPVKLVTPGNFVGASNILQPLLPKSIDVLPILKDEPLFKEKPDFNQLVSRNDSSEWATKPDLDYIPDPRHYLGESYYGILTWEHKDDLFVDFYVVHYFAVDDVEFFNNYTTGVLTPEEKQQYPHYFSQCFAEVSAVVLTHARQHMLCTTEDQHCFVVLFENTIGLLMISGDDATDIRNRSLDREEDVDPDQIYYQLQFMRFSQEAINRIGFAGSPKTWYDQVKNNANPLRVNFAPYFQTEKKP